MTRDETTNSAGQTATGAAWLDLHFEACRPEYEHIIRSVGIERGWHVLDAGCGGGSFIPMLAELVGPNGKITAMDHASENVESVRNRIGSAPVQCDVEPKVGSVVDIPLADNAVDAVWIANVLMYLSDEELETALLEFQRVTRPGGMIAAKESDGRAQNLTPIPTNLLRELGHLAPIPPRIPSILRGRQNIHWFRRVGLVDVRQLTELTERNAPLDGIAHQYYGALIRNTSAARLADDPGLSADARSWLNAQQDPDSDAALINHPDFGMCVGHIVTVGRVPPA